MATTTAYVTTTEAEDYFAGRLYADTWHRAGTPTRGAALEMATRAIDRLTLKGRRADPEQTLAFPRHPEKEVPQAVKDACCEEALSLMDHGNSQRKKLQDEGIVSVTIGSVSETYALGAGKRLLSQEARELLQPWLLGAVRIT